MVTALARTAPTAATPAAKPSVDELMVALAEVADPEIPAISIVDLGIVHWAAVAADGRIEVELLPTFIGCPAIDAIRLAVSDRLATFGRPVDVGITFEVPWTSERITAAGRRRLRDSGFAPPAEPRDVHCPFCDSPNVAMDSAFGPTLCRSLFYCRTCRQPFESFKAI
jgi:ring-1,2-phenylacetyl-CoA epoxidase subunit PaaD